MREIYKSKTQDEHIITIIMTLLDTRRDLLRRQIRKRIAEPQVLVCSYSIESYINRRAYTMFKIFCSSTHDVGVIYLSASQPGDQAVMCGVLNPSYGMSSI